jgi:hypothetical protein
VDVGWIGTSHTWMLGGLAPHIRGCWVDWHLTYVDVGWIGTSHTWMLGGLAPHIRREQGAGPALTVLTSTQGLAEYACHVIIHILDPRFLS